MKPALIRIIPVLALLCCECAIAQDKPADDPDAKPKEVPAKAAGETSKPTSEELEAKFKATFTKATMSGRWNPIKDGALGPEKEDKYSIVSASKLSGDAWVINARIQYNKKEFVAPLPVTVKWAGDTAVIIVDKMTMPGGGTYSARVLVHGNTYAGTWSGGERGGLLNGIITNEKDEKPAETK
jgi:hypothetical protein